MRILIVDDEPLARRGLRRELDGLPGIECIGECRSRDQAVTMIVEQRPDVVLLDVQLGRRTGFDVIEQVGVDVMPLVIFVTAYDKHAIKAFEVSAVDYVLKPVDPARLRDALDKASRRLAEKQGASLGDRLEQLIGTLGAPTDAAPAERIVVHEGDHGRLAFMNVADIDWIEADGNYVRLHAGAKRYPLRATMAGMEQRLGVGRDGALFIRIRRSALVNTRAIMGAEPYGRGMYSLILRSGVRLVSSRYQQEGLNKLLR